MIDSVGIIVRYRERCGAATDGWTVEASHSTLMVGRIPEESEARRLLAFLSEQEGMATELVPPITGNGSWAVVAMDT